MKKQYENRFFIFDRPIKKNIKFYIKKIIYAISSLYYRINLNMIYPKIIEQKKYNVSICAIFKNEAKYFREWIEYHKIVGIEHFYLYNNFSNDDYKEVLEPYVSEGLVTLVEWPVEQGQIACYKDCITEYKNQTKWFAIIDIDEFIVPNKYNSIYSCLSDLENRPVVIGYWKIFGASGIVDRDLNSPVIQDFIVSWSKYTDIGKCFFNTAYDFAPELKTNSVLNHYMWAKYNGKTLPPVNVFDKICYLGFNPIPNKADSNDFPLQINHYFTKSYIEYIEKKSRGDAYFKVNPRTEEYFHEHDMKCQDVDYHAYRYLIKLKKALNRLEKMR